MATFYIEAIEDTTITLSKVGSPTVGTAKYGINNTSPSTSYTYGDNITLSAGQKCYWTITSTTTAFSASNYLKFTSTGRINVGGNLSDLIGGQTAIPRNYCFYGLFLQCDKLVDASNLVIVNNFNSKTYCYAYMFYNCTSLTSAPQLSATTLTAYCYQYMFYECISLTTVPRLSATTLANRCCSNMFYGCTSLTSAPQLSATTLANYCYAGMFYDCTSLTSAPALPATTLKTYCYQQMFYNCTSLTTAPALPATTLDTYCYSQMFYNCTSLTTPPALPATTLKNYCYRNMFYGCTSLTSAPELPATTLAECCYDNMFVNCTSLTTPPALPATTLATACYRYMFTGCTNIKLSTTQTGIYQVPYRIPSSGTGTVGTNSLADMFTNTGGTFTGTPTINTTYYLYQKPHATFYIEAIEATTITLSKVGSPTVGSANYGINDTSVPNSYNYGDSITLSAGQKCYWTITSTTTAFSTSNYLKFTSTGRINVGGNLSDLIGGQTAIPRDYCFCKLFNNCTKLVDASNLVMVNNFNSKTSCYYTMFFGCTSLTSAPQLSATTLANYCYAGMFYDCTSLTSAPALPATTLSSNCYSGMFYNCTSLVLAPELPATTLAGSCYSTMFFGCTSLTTPPQLPATTLTKYCYSNMFYGCTSLMTPPQLPATTLDTYCYYNMFYGCTNIKLSSTQTGIYQVLYRIPSSGTGTDGDDSLTDMFTNTGGTFTGTPTINTAYYMPYPVSITYNGNYVVGMESGAKTLNCSGKYMKGNIVIAANKPVDITYNGTKIISNATGTKILNCANKTMSGNVVVETATVPVYYHFYTSSNVEITDISVAGLSNAYYYTKGINDTAKKRVGGRIFYINENAVEGTDDRFYVYDNTTHTTGSVSVTGGITDEEMFWDWDFRGRVGITTDGIGKGKSNTLTALAFASDWDNYEIFGYIKNCNNNNLNSCNDWFIMSKAEQDKLRASSLVNWYSSMKVWSSVEYNGNPDSFAYYWDYRGSNWYDADKGLASGYDGFCTFAGRSF